MNQTHHQECFGTMFPDVLHVENDRQQRGKVFSLLLERAGGMYRCNREVAGDVEQWDECRKCPEFDNCYQFSTAKLLLASAIVSE
jgi:hypothetical protein